MIAGICDLVLIDVSNWTFDPIVRLSNVKAMFSHFLRVCESYSMNEHKIIFAYLEYWVTFEEWSDAGFSIRNLVVTVWCTLKKALVFTNLILVNRWVKWKMTITSWQSLPSTQILTTDWVQIPDDYQLGIIAEDLTFCINFLKLNLYPGHKLSTMLISSYWVSLFTHRMILFDFAAYSCFDVRSSFIMAENEIKTVST